MIEVSKNIIHYQQKVLHYIWMNHQLSSLPLEIGSLRETHIIILKNFLSLRNSRDGSFLECGERIFYHIRELRLEEC